MARDFGVTNPVYLKALEDIREIHLPDSHYQEVLKALFDEEQKAIQLSEQQKVSLERLHKQFTL